MGPAKRFEHMSLAEKLQNNAIKQEHINQELLEGGVFKFLGLTNRKVGPPVGLDLKDKECWDAKVQSCLKTCVSDILMPTVRTENTCLKRNFITAVNEELERIEEGVLRAQILKGFSRAQKKWGKREVYNNLSIPASLDNFAEQRGEEVGLLRRGEVLDMEAGFLVHDNNVNKSRDLYKILAYSIYGAGKFRNFIVRSIWKYINVYYKIEGELFVPHMGRLNNGTDKWISSWPMFCAFLKNRDLSFSTYELSLTSRLYDVNIRVFLKEGDGLECAWQTKRKCNRVINLFLSPGNFWSVLCGQKATVETTGVRRSKKSDEVSSITDSLVSLVSDKVENRVEGMSIVADSLDNDTRDSWDNEDKVVIREVDSSKEAVGESELDWSLITSDSDSRRELRSLEEKVFQQLGELDRPCKKSDEVSSITDSLASLESNKVENRVESMSTISDSSDNNTRDSWNNNAKVWSGDSIIRDIDNSKEAIGVSGLDWSLITSDSDSRRELMSVEEKVTQQLGKLDILGNRGKNSSSTGKGVGIKKGVVERGEVGNNVGSKDLDSRRELIDIQDRILAHTEIDRNVLDCSLITISTVASRQRELVRVKGKEIEDISNGISIDGVGNHSESNSIRVRSRVSSVDTLGNNIYSEDRKVMVEGTGNNSTQNRYSNGDSTSSIEEDLKWLFEEEVSDAMDCSSEGGIESMEVRRTSDSEDNYRDRVSIPQLGDKTRRRSFWLKWKSKIRNSNRNSNRKKDKQLLREGIQKKNTDVVFDFYSKGLDRTEIELLSKGSTFCIASSKVDEDRFKADIYAYSRRLRLHEEYRDNRSQGLSQVSGEQRDSQVSNDSSLANNSTPDRYKMNRKKGRKLPSTYDPDSQNRNLARYCNCIQEESLLAIKAKTKFRDNITPEHRAALKTLKKKVEDKVIIITLADKGSGIVVVDYDTYIEKGTKYIEIEAKAYSETSKSQKQIVSDIVNQRNKIVKKLREHQVIEVDTATYCMKQLEEKVTGMKFYYKVHKDNNIDTMPLRPLQSCIGSPTHHLSQVLTDLLQPYLTTECIPTFIQDSNQLLYRLSKIDNLDNNCTLVSADVSALYPSIPHKEGLEAVRMFLSEWSDYNQTQIKYIMLALELVITQNFVRWNDKIYSQDSGVAMGTPVAVAYANIFMDWIDRLLRQKATYILEHIRYIDDNLFIVPEDKIDELMAEANALLVPHIRFTHEQLDKNSETGLPFLDTQLYISSELTIESRLYTKKTDKHTYLLPASFHPSHITRNIPLAVFNRIRRICSRYAWFQADAMLAMEWLEDRGYSYVDIKRAVEKSSKRDRWEMIEKIESNRISKFLEVERKVESTYEVPIIITYCHNAKVLKEVLKKRQTLLDASFNQTKVRPRVAFRRQKNISDILIQKGLRKPIADNQEEDNVLECCGSKHRYRIPCPCKGSHDQQICRCCAHLRVEVDNIQVKLHKKVNCESKNLIYLLGCKICHKLYVGETQQQLKDRFLQHLNNVTKLSQPLYIHFRQVHKPENMYITVLESVRSSDHTFRKIREAWWINRLQTLEPRGFNIKLECSQIYQASSTTINVERGRSSRRMG